MKTNTDQMNASETFCPNAGCIARGKIGQGNIVIHGRKRPRYKCKTCEKTFSANEGTMFVGLRKPVEPRYPVNELKEPEIASLLLLP